MFALTQFGIAYVCAATVGNPTESGAFGAVAPQYPLGRYSETMDLATDPTSDFSALDLSRLSDPCDDLMTLQKKAERCRRLAAGISDRQAAEVLTALALGYEASAQRLTTED